MVNKKAQTLLYVSQRQGKQGLKRSVCDRKRVGFGVDGDPVRRARLASGWYVVTQFSVSVDTQLDPECYGHPLRALR